MTVVATYPSAGGRRVTRRMRVPRKEYARSRHQRLFEENVGKNRKRRDLRTFKWKVQELFTCGEGLSTPHVHHKGRQPLIKCAKSWLQYLFIFLLFTIFTFWGQQERGFCSYVSSSVMRSSNLHSSLKSEKVTRRVNFKLSKSSF